MTMTDLIDPSRLPLSSSSIHMTSPVDHLHACYSCFARCKSSWGEERNLILSDSKDQAPFKRRENRIRTRLITVPTYFAQWLLPRSRLPSRGPLPSCRWITPRFRHFGSPLGIDPSAQPSSPGLCSSRKSVPSRRSVTSTARPVAPLGFPPPLRLPPTVR
jgi:hypothetical protein